MNHTSVSRYSGYRNKLKIQRISNHHEPAKSVSFPLHFSLKKSLAYEDLIRSLEQDPTHTEAQTLLASLQTEASLKREEAVRLRFAGNKEEAVKQITSAIETNPSVPEYNVFRGSLYRQMDMYNKAQSDFHTAVYKCGRSAVHPVHRLAMKQLALTYNDVAVEHFRRRRFKEAMRLLNQAIDIEKTEKVLYSNRGDCFYQMREYHFAQSDYEQALELVPEDWGMRTRLAVVYCDIGVEEHRGHKSTQALKHFDLAIQSNPKVSRFYTCRAAVKHAMNDAPGAQRDCIFALLLDPDNQDTQSVLARVFPGQSAHEVLKSARADRTRRELETMIAQSATVTKPKPSLLPQEAKNRDSVYGIDLKVIDSSELEEFTNNPADNVSEDEELGRLFGGDVDSSGDLPHTEDVPSYSAGEDMMLSPRARELIAKPLPPIPSTGAGVMPDLKSCLKEAQFHSDMYYTKKESNESFRKFLCKPQQISPALPKIGIPQDVKFGQHRTIAPIPRDLTTK
jgi:tetratricopeptide (TPR) repeat protein